MADNYPTGPAGSSENSLHHSVGGLLPPRPLPPRCSRCQGLWQTSPTWSPRAQPPPAHLLLISSWWGRHCRHSWGSKQVASTHGVRARQPWRTGCYLPVGEVASPKQEREVCFLTIPEGCHQWRMLRCAASSVLVIYLSSSTEAQNCIWALGWLWTCALASTRSSCPQQTSPRWQRWWCDLGRP